VLTGLLDHFVTLLSARKSSRDLSDCNGGETLDIQHHSPVFLFDVY